LGQGVLIPSKIRVEEGSNGNLSGVGNLSLEIGGPWIPLGRIKIYEVENQGQTGGMKGRKDINQDIKENFKGDSFPLITGGREKGGGTENTNIGGVAHVRTYDI